MIRVDLKPEYPGFDNDVRKRGTSFLATCPTPNSQQFRKNNFWSKAARELHAAYSGICAYTAMYLPDQGSVDHYLPKASHPKLAYEWANFRLASGRVNSAKGDSTNILDPFHIQNSWFFIDIPSCLLKANPSLPKKTKSQISMSINSLRLNQDDNYVQERCSILIDYTRGDISKNFLDRRYPFLSKEIDRQNLDRETLRTLFKI